MAARLRCLPATGDATLIAVTGYGTETERHNSLAAGFHHHLVKPIDLAALGTLLRELN